jgi:hypothetical protein
MIERHSGVVNLQQQRNPRTILNNLNRLPRTEPELRKTLTLTSSLTGAAAS